MPPEASFLQRAGHLHQYNLNHGRRSLCALAGPRYVARLFRGVPGLLNPKGESPDQLQANLLDLYKDLASGEISGIRRVAEFTLG